MRYSEIVGGIRIPVFGEEQELLDKINAEGGTLDKSGLSEREQQLAFSMVSRGVLKRIKRDDRLALTTNKEDIWRF